MARELQRIFLPELYKYFNQRRMKERLRIVAWWGNSFEKWLQWETVFALEPVMQKMKGDPWDYDKWRIEHEPKHKRKSKSKSVRWDMVMPGKRPLFLQFKICIPCWGIPPELKKGVNSLTADIASVRRFRNGAAAALLFTLEHEDASMPIEDKGFPRPRPRFPKTIQLGRTWCEGCKKERNMWARIYCWTNSQ